MPPLKWRPYLGASQSRASASGKDRPPLGYNLILTGLSDIGRVRKRNEDSLFLAPDIGVAGVADGMGGHPGGDVASRIAADYAVDRLRALLPECGAPPPDGIVQALRGAMAQTVLGAHQAVRTEGARVPDLYGMGTTLTCLAVDRKSGTCAIGHVGDSRVYRLRGGELTQLTRDDTWVQKRLDAEELTPAQARRHPFGHILTQCLGLDEAPEPQVLTDRVANGDVYLLCTDGLIGMLTDQDLGAVLRESGGNPDRTAALELAAGTLVTLAKERGGFDNITVVLAGIRPD